MKRFRILLMALAATLALTLAIVPLGCKKKDIVASGKDVEVTKEMVDKTTSKYLKQGGLPKNMPAKQRKLIEKQLRKQIIETLINEQILEVGAKKEGIEISDEELNKSIETIKKNFGSEKEFNAFLKKQGQTIEDIKNNIKKQLLYKKLNEKLTKNKVKVSEKELLDYYNKNKFQFNQQEKVKASHILVKTQKEAQDIQNKLKAGEDFTALAKKSSIEPAAKQSGGSLGEFEKGQMVPEFTKVAFSLKVGQISGPVKTQFGWHIIKVEGKKPAKSKSYAEVKAEVKTLVTSQKESEILNSWLEKQKKELNVKMVKS